MKKLTILAVLILLSGCATTDIKPSASNNPPPSKSFNQYADYTLYPVVLAPEYADYDANQAAAKKIQENLDMRVNALIAEWKKTPNSSVTGTLEIRPTIKQVKFVNSMARFWSGVMAGSSAVVLILEIKEKETGAVIAMPEFYNHALGNGFSLGYNDNMMLVHITEQVEAYLRDNYASAVGGPTEKDEE
jgi:hypothetical protein